MLSNTYDNSQRQQYVSQGPQSQKVSNLEKPISRESGYGVMRKPKINVFTNSNINITSS